MNSINKRVMISEEDLSISDLVSIARFNVPLYLSNESIEKINKARDLINEIIKEGKIVYGVTTGVGDNSKVKISTSDSNRLQENLIKSHACGVGAPLEAELVKAVMVVMIKNLSLGFSGIRVETVEALINLVNNNIIPIVPREGSLGYLSYQAHISLVLLGRGSVYYQGKVMKSQEALEEVGLTPIQLYEKEGLSLLNGTADMTAIGAVVVYDALNVMKTADVASMISFESLKGTKYAFDERISDVKPHPGQKATIVNVNHLLDGSEIAEEFKGYRTQDALSIRAIPQVHGACKETVNHVKQIIEREMNSATDNPLIFISESYDLEDSIISSANCHGESVAMVLDYLAISVSEIASISERRIFRLVSPQYSELPPFLIKDGGINSGYMIPQYVAASLVSDNKRYSSPSVVDSITTSAGQEDHVSMGTSASLKALKVVINAQRVIGIEFLSGCQGIEFLRPLKSGQGVESAYNIFRSYVPRMEEDRVIYDDIKNAEMLVRTEKIIQAVENNIGELAV